ncbi:MAG: DUF4034 domain-containing protein [Acidobacteriia bacterium]|nr:DUF4034 domain-containing protein [Terriglobia bacterium]
MIRQSSLALFGLILSASLATAQEPQSLGDIARTIKAQKQAARNANGSSSSSKSATPAANTGAATPQPAPAAATAATSPEEIVPDLNPNVATDIHGIEKYEAAIRQLFQQEKFAEIDRIASEARTTKARFAGGYWKVHTIYLALEEPGTKTKAGEAEWTQHLARLEKWKEQFPNSITARIVLAEAYNSYGWKARGTGYANQVTDEGWQLLAERVHKGQTILEEAEGLPEKCPEWYAAMIEIARSEDWEQDQLQALFRKAVAFEPEYYYYYRMLADSLLPKWGGEEGDAARFAAAVADGIGGKKGDLIYFEIATTLVCACGNVHEQGLKGLSWPRIKAGYSALQELYGTSISHINEMALIAFRASDFDYATIAFNEIGDNWDKAVWHTLDSFYDSRYQAAIPHIQNSLAAATENVKTPEGQLFSYALGAEMDRRYHQPFLDCVKASPGYTQPWIGLLVELTKEGAVRDVLFAGADAPSACIRPLLEKAILPTPPKADYWVMVQMDVNR